MERAMNDVARVVGALLVSGAHRATKYVSEKFVVNATRPFYGGKAPRKGSKVEIVVTMGRPNYAHRAFIRRCKKAGEPLPVRKIQLKFSPAR